ncbi:MAG: ATP synthase F1 subunit epsilon [Candidatus Marinimicrobia bacterium]|jgi:F-type H+-transporting ATPase subunit epsilon|nr:ATP synthase F1 subunit epsilon [Candidatus Neomarinimicrobiota bacterium]MBT3575232.1 ATP synthase F1 subunit epsilon [Candidatus Neomarinimicrobiota bacterium]MBT3680331.1 ATP synthase F1 subunit epsilon [Candidatus Neomarinimicrobiota bacterium]MBT3951760.1 ATP synthase F1 subunit epsilon [Candidatus Neomarinimicrobiota bacterium]MBT4252806.1 ATP synthase F1 subunit epsilon [Candidatus Neomarinimicrobiota bacterium]
MAGQFHLEIVTPTKVYDEGEVDYLRAPGVDGAFGVLAGHTESIMALAIGEIKVVKGSVEKTYASAKGFAEITHNGVQLLVESAEPQDDIDLTRAQEAFDRAKEHLTRKQDEMEDELRALRALERSMNRLKVAEKK